MLLNATVFDLGKCKGLSRKITLFVLFELLERFEWLECFPSKGELEPFSGLFKFVKDVSRHTRLEIVGVSWELCWFWAWIWARDGEWGWHICEVEDCSNIGSMVSEVIEAVPQEAWRCGFRGPNVVTTWKWWENLNRHISTKN